MKALLVILVLMSLVTTFGLNNCNEGSGADTLTESPEDQNIMVSSVSLTARAPFSTATVIIDNTGNMKYEAKGHDEATGGDKKQSDNGQISEGQFRELETLLIDNCFWSFDENYTDKSLFDGTTYIVTVIYTDSQSHDQSEVTTKSVSCYGECPEEIFEIRSKIKELWGKEILEVGV